MSEGVNGPVCTCGESLDMYHGVTVCPHCDQGCEPRYCAICRRYFYRVENRTNHEYAMEKRQQPNGPQ